MFDCEHNTPLDDDVRFSFTSMASRPLLPGRPSNATHSPVRQSVALRWINSAAAAPAAPEPVHSSVKWCPSRKTEVSLHAPVIATSAPTAAQELAVKKKSAASSFQSARAVFEAKKASAAAPPPPPPTRRRLTFPAPPPPPHPVTKQQFTASDFSVSTCSTVDSESDRKLEESLEVKVELKPSSPVHIVVKKMEEQSVVDTPSERYAVKVSPHTAEFALPPPVQAVQAPQPRDPAVSVATSKQIPQGQPNHSAMDPFRLLLPVETIPTLPDEVICVYDSTAVDMEKNIKKVVRKLLKKDKARQEEFKVNSRLFGTDFMDAHAYLDTLIKDFGPIRALQLVPCLLSVQPNMVKGKALLLTAKNYLLRNEKTLKRELQSVQAPSPNKIITAPRARARLSSYHASTAANTTGNVVAISTTGIGTVAAKATIVETSIKAPKTTLQNSTVVKPTGGGPQNAVGGPSLRNVDNAVSSCLPPHVQLTVPEVVPVPVAVVVQKQQANITTEEVEITNKDIKPVEPAPEPQGVAATGTPPPLIYIDVSAPSQTPVAASAVQKFAPVPVVKKRAESVTPSDSKEESRAENLFGMIFTPSLRKQKNSHLDIPVAPTSPVSSVHSFDEAESLFGERLSSSSRTSPGRRKTVTWGETQMVEVPAEKASAMKTVKKPAPLLFGLATAAAFDSDSDESDFSD